MRNFLIKKDLALKITHLFGRGGGKSLLRVGLMG